MMSRQLMTFALMLALLPCAAMAAPHFVAASVYHDARFGFRLDLPAGYRRSALPVHGDGRMFASQDGRVRIRAWGRNQSASPTAAAALQSEVHDRRNLLKYHKEGPGWRAACWVRAGRVYFVKVFEGKGASNSLMISYPVNVPALAGKERSLVRGFHPGDLRKPH